MRRIYLLVACFLISTLTIAQVSVTFQVDMSETTPSKDGVYVTGNWMDDAENIDGGEWQEPGSNEDAKMTNSGNDIYTLTVTLPAGTFEYKYANGNGFENAEAGSDSDTYQADLTLCNGVENGVGGYNRVMFVGNDDLSLTAYKFNSCEVSTTSVFEPTSTLRGLEVMPNPFSDRTLVRLDNPTGTEHQLILTNTTGQVVKLVTGVVESYDLQRDELPRGMYFLTIRNDRGEVASEKIVIR